MEEKPVTLVDQLVKRGMTRRQFLRFCGMTAVVLGLPLSTGEIIAQALATTPKLPVIWLEFQDCTGDTEAFLRASRRADIAVSGKTDPSLTELILDVLSIDYQETLMAAAGHQAEKSRQDTISGFPGKYICVVEGAIPTALNGYCCTVGGKSAVSILQEVSSQAQLTIAFGSCAWDGGLAAANPNPTGAKGVKDVLPNLANLINIPGCPANPVNLVATLVYFQTYNQLPALDTLGRPKFAYSDRVHDKCQRRGNAPAQAFGDANYRAGGCLKGLGCNGPSTYANCPTVRWNDGYCWPILAGHGCIGCTNSHFWDTMLPVYK